jgi:structural maintenance of chromosome 4
MVRATRTSTAGARRSASAVPVTSPVQSSPKRRRRVIPSPSPESDDEGSDSSIMTAVTAKSTSTVASAISSRAPRRSTRGRPSSTRQTKPRRTTRNTLTTDDLIPEVTTPKPTRQQLTPVPTEPSRSVTPTAAVKVEPATPIKPELLQDSPQGGSDKENQVPLLAVPSLLGSVKKGQQLTPPPEYVSPRKLDIARLTAMEDAAVAEGPRNRIVITHLVLNNFKSYAGRQVIGPFHTVYHQ